MHGACSGCPSSTVTLKRGIESLIRHYVPEVEPSKRSEPSGLRRRAACDHYPPHDPGVRHVERRLHRRLVRRRGACIARSGRADRPRPCRAAGADDRRDARRPRSRRTSWSASARAASPASASGSPPRTAWRSAGMPSFAACPRSRCSPPARAANGEVAAAIIGGHGELFVQQFDAATLEPASRAAQPAARRSRRGRDRAELVVGSGAAQLVEARGWGEAREAWPSAADALRFPETLRTLARQAGLCPRARRARRWRRRDGDPGARPRRAARARRRRDDLDAVMAVMDAAFGDRFGEAWTRSQCAGILPMAGVSLTLARDARQRRAVIGFSLSAASPTNPSCCCSPCFRAVIAQRHRRPPARRFHRPRARRRRRPRPSRSSRRQSGRSACIARRFHAGRAAPQLLSGADGARFDALTLARDL